MNSFARTLRGKKLRILKHLLFFTFLIFITFHILKLYETVHNTKNHQETLKIVKPQEIIRNEKPLELKIDYHDYEQIQADRNRKGPGEQGEAVNSSLIPKDLMDKLYKENGYNAALSDIVSLHRSLPDARPQNCKHILYKKSLPSVSVIIPFHNEHLSVVLRTVWSVTKRSPEHLIKDIILVDDCSTKEFLKGDLETYLKKNIPKAKVLRIKKRSGLIIARIEGAKIAKGEVLIFLDAHCEANVNWLPPLLEIISNDYKTCVCPFIDPIDYDTYKYIGGDGARGAFDWHLVYRFFAKFKRYRINDTEPFANPVMAGGLFAISAKYFWELGGYDEGLFIWGGEQYELSFKIWQCGGKLLDVPCSRVGHLYRKFGTFTNPDEKVDYLCMNFRRVAEVWMDEYKQYYYMRHPDCAKMAYGDISKQIALRKKLNCKSFKWFMEEVAYDVMNRYPGIEPPDVANGEIRNIGHPDVCVETAHKEASLHLCSKGSWAQRIQFTWRGEIKHETSENCWDVGPNPEIKQPIKLLECHFEAGNQRWMYDEKTKNLKQASTALCLDMDIKLMKMYLTSCIQNSKTQQWTFQNFNKTQQDNVQNYVKKMVVEEKL